MVRRFQEGLNYACAYKLILLIIFVDSIKLTIIGDKNSAARFNTAVTESIAIEYSDSEDVSNSNVRIPIYLTFATAFFSNQLIQEGQSHHHRRKTKTQIREEKIKKLLTKHPLAAKLQIFLKGQ